MKSLLVFYYLEPAVCNGSETKRPYLFRNYSKESMFLEVRPLHECGSTAIGSIGFIRLRCSADICYLRRKCPYIANGANERERTQTCLLCSACSREAPIYNTSFKIPPVLHKMNSFVLNKTTRSSRRSLSLYSARVAFTPVSSCRRTCPDGSCFSFLFDGSVKACPSTTSMILRLFI